MSERVGIVGVGLMGQAFAHHLLDHGYEVQGFDLSPQRMAELEAQGGIPVDSPAAAADGVRWLLTSLPNGDIMRKAVFGPGGIAEKAAPGTILADATTSRPQDSEKLGGELAERGIRFLDATVSGTSSRAWQGDLIVIAGGSKADFDASTPYFQTYSRAAYHMGPIGSGAMTKLIVNLVLGGNRFALGEGLVLGMKSGVDMETLVQVLQDGSASSKTMIDKGPRMVAADYSPDGLVRNSLKDMRLALEQGNRFGSPMLMTAVYAQLQQAAAEQGLAECDNSAFIEVLRQMAGLPRRV